MELPKAFEDEMKGILGEEYPLFLKCYERSPYRGIRLNPLKCDEETLKKSVPFELEASPFSPYSFYVKGEEKVGSLPAHHAGMFYAQEPSASSAVTALAPQPGERVLDLCAAPGGKSTQIAGLMVGKGLLWSNEIVRGRARILNSNLERVGVRNAVVSSCHPQKLCQRLQGFFHRVLVDAPCSGEGMFRRDPAAVGEWSPEGVSACANRQRALLDSAALAVAQNGILVYSTCTFSKEENEETVEAFLKDHPEFQIAPVEESFGRPALNGLPARRIFPMDGGEGHFVAKFLRTGENPCSVSPFPFLPVKERAQGEELYETLFWGSVPEFMAKFGEKLFLLPEELPGLLGLNVLRTGVEIGEFHGNRLEPSHCLFMSRKKADCRNALDLSPDDPTLMAFLRGEEIPCEKEGYTAVCVNGVITGFGKASGGRLKNKYPKGLRNLR